MKQPHTEETIVHTGDDQNTGNHKVPGAKDEKGADRLGGTRTGSQNVEKGSGGGAAQGRSSADEPAGDLTGGSHPHAERAPDRDENGRL